MAGSDTRSCSRATAGTEEGAGGGRVVTGTPQYPGFLEPRQLCLRQGQPGHQLPASPPEPGVGQAEIQRRRRAPHHLPRLWPTCASVRPTFPCLEGSPVWRWLWGPLGLEKLLEPALRLSGRARAVTPQGRQGWERRCGAGALGRMRVPAPADTAGRGLCSDALTPARIAGVQGRADLHSPQPGENLRKQGWGTGETPESNRMGGFPKALSALQVQVPGAPAPRLGSRGWDLLGLARRGLRLTQKSPFPAQGPTGGIWQQLRSGMLC